MGKLRKVLWESIKAISGREANLVKFFAPTVSRGKTVWPKSAADLLRHGVRWDYDGIIQLSDGQDYHKYQLQPNAGNIPSTIKRWRDSNGGTHAVIATMYIKTGQEADNTIFEESAAAALEDL